MGKVLKIFILYCLIDIKCLKIIMVDKTKQLVPECRSLLSKRLEMYKNAEEVSQHSK